MGLLVHDLGNLPDTLDGRDFFIYMLEYGWHEPMTQALRDNFTNMAKLAAGNRAAVVAGIEPVHFMNDVFSWHHINGEDADAILPAILISTLTPSYFRDNYQEYKGRGEIDDKLLLIPLRTICKTTEDVVSVVRSIFSDIKSKNTLSDFKVAKELKKRNSGGRRLADAMILEPNISGIGIDLKKLLSIS